MTERIGRRESVKFFDDWHWGHDCIGTGKLAQALDRLCIDTAELVAEEVNKDMLISCYVSDGKVEVFAAAFDEIILSRVPLSKLMDSMVVDSIEDDESANLLMQILEDTIEKLKARA